ncbi:hypothetical protein H0H81_008520 [Sphagnurus paluster]|uniref:Uncharacterized protein n=1 Tax=Sphagnurus paluster TaxID=117069 RepID=A0A9P7FSL3_9AGAR|nr:hypothetical protein H0H81_008520 [Sphagnurus paluster]
MKLAVTPKPIPFTDGRAIFTALEATEATITNRCLIHIVQRKATYNAPMGEITALVSYISLS